MKTFLVCFDCGNGIFSSNMIMANTGNQEYEAVKDTAERRAERYGNTVAAIRELSDCEARTNTRKGMPCYMIDDEAEEKYDLSYIAARANA